MSKRAYEVRLWLPPSAIGSEPRAVKRFDAAHAADALMQALDAWDYTVLQPCAPGVRIEVARVGDGAGVEMHVALGAVWEATPREVTS